MKEIIVSIIYFIASIAFFLYFFYDSSKYLKIDPTLHFLSIYIPLILLSYVQIYIIWMDEREKFFKTTGLCLLGIVCITLMYEIVKPNYTYEEAKQIVAREYDVEVQDSFLTTIPQAETGKENYRMNVIQDSNEIVVIFNPYTKEILFLN